MKRTLLVTLLLLLTVGGLAWGLGTLSIPTQFVNATGNQPAALLDTNFTTIANYVNNRELVVGLLANRPAAQFNGRLYFATDSGVGTLYLDDGSTWRSSSPVPVFRSYLAGCTLSNDGTSPNTVIDVAACFTTSSDQTTFMTLAAITGSTGGTWVVGTGSNKMDTGAVAANTFYHVYVIERTDTAVVDILFSLQPVAGGTGSPTLPANYTKQRRIGSFKTATGTTNILAFTQRGDLFEWLVGISEFAGTATETVGVTRTLSGVPVGVVVRGVFTHRLTGGGAARFSWLSDLAVTNTAPAQNGPCTLCLAAAANDETIGNVIVQTTTSQGIRSRQDSAGGTLGIMTDGYYDRRGKDD